jgi:5-methylcytosine-specific restriction endonuclease McrA
MAKKVRNPRVPRTRNAGTMTESAFWGGIRSALRQKSRWWKPAAEAKKKARKKYIGPNKRRKWVFECAECKGLFPDKEIHIDHIIPAGSLRCYDDLPGFVERLFCEVDGFQVLCETCHHTKTQKERKNKKK